MAMLRPLSTLLFSCRGRINRALYWLIGIGSLVGVAICFSIIFAIAKTTNSIWSTFCLPPLIVALLWISLATAVKRLHDRDKSAWWLMLFYVLPSILDAIGNIGRAGQPILGIISSGIGIWALAELGFARGTDGLNGYGPDPLER